MVDDVREERLASCQELIGYRFRDLSLLKLALTHASDKPTTKAHLNGEIVSEVCPPIVDNERLEFLGDAVLGMIVCETLYAQHPEFTEGELTAIKSVVVSRTVLAKVSRQTGLARFLSLGKGMGGLERLPRSLEANVFEAVVGAIYLDGGMEPTREFVLHHLSEQVELVKTDRHQKNYKSLLQQYTQRELGATPTYRVVAEEGPDHIKQFDVVAVIDGRAYGSGHGKSKKDAEQQAAESTLGMLMEESELPASPSPLSSQEPERTG